MIATDFKLIPLSALCKYGDVLRNLKKISATYVPNLLEDPELRRAFLIYALLTHWPNLVDGVAEEDLLANRLYWFFRTSKQYERDHDFEAGYEREAGELLLTAKRELGSDMVQEIEHKVRVELATGEWEVAVAFSEFSVRKVKKQLGIQIDRATDFFADVMPANISLLLTDTLKESLPLALAIGTEKARSEMIVAPVLMEVRRQLGGKVSLHSGIELDVDEAEGLCGRCDFLMGLTAEQHTIEAPLLAVVEVKSEATNAGIAQCIAEMVAARIFNRQNQVDLPTVYGVVTTGSTWKFIRLVENTAFLDISEYYIKEVERIVGIIVSMFTSSGIAKNSVVS